MYLNIPFVPWILWVEFCFMCSSDVCFYLNYPGIFDLFSIPKGICFPRDFSGKTSHQLKDLRSESLGESFTNHFGLGLVYFCTPAIKHSGKLGPSKLGSPAASLGFFGAVLGELMIIWPLRVMKYYDLLWGERFHYSFILNIASFRRLASLMVVLVLEPQGQPFINGCFHWMMNQIFI